MTAAGTTPTPEEQARYDALFGAVFPLYERGEWDAALALLRDRGPGIEHWSSELVEVEACLHALAGRPAEALDALRRGLDAGDWWAEQLLMNDEDLASVRDDPAFAEIVREGQARADAWNAAARPETPVLLPAEGTARGVLVVLHGGGTDGAAGTAPRWAAATRAGVTVLAVQSRQRVTPLRVGWSDPRLTAADIEHALGFLDDRAAALPLTAGGFSAGARTVLLWALSARPVPVTTVLAVTPAITARNLAEVGEPGAAQGLVLLGSDDPLLAEPDVAERLAASGLRVETVPGLGHDYPADFDGRLTAELAHLS